MGKKLNNRKQKENVPGPNQYNPNVNFLGKYKNAKSFKMHKNYFSNKIPKSK